MAPVYQLSFYAHFPSKAINPAPRHMHANAVSVVERGLLRMSVLKRNSCAMSSTSPVYKRIPAETESNTPLMMSDEELPGVRRPRTPKPAAMAMGVDRP